MAYSNRKKKEKNVTLKATLNITSGQHLVFYNTLWINYHFHIFLTRNNYNNYYEIIQNKLEVFFLTNSF